VENKGNLLSLPLAPNTIALGGMGNAVTLLRYCRWLERHPVIYWGDIDVQGFEILARLRAVFPKVQSVMMNLAALRTFEEFHVKGNARTAADPPSLLTEEEREVFMHCASQNIRLEQERLPQWYVIQNLPNRF